MVEIKSVGVIGAGQMGSGIAHVCALGGYDVMLHDVSRERIDAGIANIERALSRQVSRGLIDQAAMDAALARIKPADELQTVGGSDLAIEAATENEEVKKTIFRALAPHLAGQTLLASNTSSISITRLASATDRPERFIGLHFMNPVPRMNLVEIIRGIATDADTYETA
ncbi:MAG: 3-hydroxyacyl-CoA dehydrogenase NAD-binding domain-containing protein, partial [Caulobacteraceae bacterium]|nr:3-hydroxyacyl-CoA dehydrogenase NAD-binding domain-containing protein [Caulobacteraceae bacterium]